MFRRSGLIVIVSVLVLFLFLTSPCNILAEEKSKEEAKESILKLSLAECLKRAIEKNRQRQVSKTIIEIAEAQHRQALSAYWPQLSFVSSVSRIDEDPNFIFPSENFTLMGLTIPIAERDITLMGRDSFVSSAELLYPVYTFGKRSSIVKQAKIGTEVAKESAKRSDLQIIYDVKRFYYGTVLAARLKEIGQDTLERFEITLELTESLYKRGSGKVKKTDYLETQVIVSSMRSMQEMLISNEELAKSALANSMGMEWNNRVEVSEKEIAYDPLKFDLTKLVNRAYRFNPDWTTLQLGINAAEAKIREAKSGHYPIVAFTGSLTHLENSYGDGLVNSNNDDSWKIGLALKLPLFNGFRTTNDIKEAKARLKKIKHQEVLFREGLALQVKNIFLQIKRTMGQVKATEKALGAALESRKLNNRAYQHELVETEDVIKAQLLESFINAQHLKARHEHAVNRAMLDFVIGNRIKKLFEK